MTAALDRFRAAVMADEPAQQRLAAIADPAEFVRAATEWAAGRGLALAADDLAAALGADPLGIGLLGEAPLRGASWPPRQWMPLRYAPEAAAVDWIHFAGRALAAPHFEADVRPLAARPFNRLFRWRTALDDFVRAPRDGSLVPDGFVFHMSRCGSTLVAQMLAAVPHHIVVSEAEPLDTMVQLARIDPALAPAAHIEAVRAMVAALGRDRTGGARRYFVKLDSWHALALPLFRAAFPDTPWVFLYRDPVEVLASHERRPGRQTAPGALLGHAAGSAAAGIEHTAQVLARTCEAAADALSRGGGLLVDYRELPEALFARILPHFGAAPDAAERAAMAAASRRDAKVPDTEFAPDSEAKRRQAGDAARAAAGRHLSGVHARLEALRAAP